MRLATRHLVLPALVLAAAAASAAPTAPQEPVPGLHLEGSPPAPRPGPSRVLGPQTTVENGTLCTTIDFEGVGNLRPIPEFDGIRSPDWLAIIDADAGGTGNVAHEPSPSTIAFWLGGPDGTGSSRDVVFAEPAAIVDLFYASAVTTRMEAFDDRGTRVATATGAANYNRGPGGDPTGAYDRWDRLRLEVDENRISRIRVFGAINQTGIDDLKVCRRTGVDTVEITQAIQELQDLDDLKADLAGDGEPPVPIVRDKPAAMRVYFREVQAKTELRIEAEIGGTRKTQTVTLIPGCTREKMRRQDGCASADFDFVPSTAQVPIELVVTDASGRQIERHEFRLKTREASALVLSAVEVCDSHDAQGAWSCTPSYLGHLANMASVLRIMAPSPGVRVIDSGKTVRRSTDADGDGTATSKERSDWWPKVLKDLEKLFKSENPSAGQVLRYFGPVDPRVRGGRAGRAAGIPSNSALGLTSASLLGKDVSRSLIAHEVFHTLGRRHTDKKPPVRSAAPGCLEKFAGDHRSRWPYNDNYVQSGPRNASRREVGYDTASHSAVPLESFDVMSYCAPHWISPYTYVKLLEGGLRKTGGGRRTKARAEGRFWLVAGGVEGGELRLDPIFETVERGPTERGEGPYRIEVRSGGGAVLFIRRFTPSIPEDEVLGGTAPRNEEPFFAELVPVQPGAARIVVLDPAGQVLLSARLEGAAPAVTLTSPAGGGTVRGTQEIRWRVNDPDGGKHHFWVRYSPDGGALGSWRSLGFVEEPRLRVDFDRLPGSSGRSVVQVLASDGVNSAAATSAAFTVPTGGPEATITFPTAGAIFRRSQSVWLQGAGFDGEDGALEGGSLTWRSDRDGLLGHGESLPVADLSPGPHTVTLTARDSDSNTVRREVHLTVAGAGPTLDLQVEALDSLPTTCVEVTLAARARSVGLKRVEYSLDGGESWTGVPLSRLPHRFTVPGSGFFHLVARTFDQADQLAADDARFFTDSACRDAAPPTPPPPRGDWLTTRELPGFRFKARITSGGRSTEGRRERDCIGETLCLSGNLPGRAELFTRIIGPRPNGKLWVNLVRFTPSEVELWIEQTGSGEVNYYRLAGLPQGGDTLTGLVDKEAFVPDGRPGRRPGAVLARLAGMPGVDAVEAGTPVARPAAEESPSSIAREVVFRSPELPGYRFTVRIFSGGEIPARRELDCLAETACVSGAVAGRSEIFVRLIGPRPNGHLWVNLVRFTTSRVEVDVLQDATGRTRRYVLPAIDRESDSLDGLVDTTAFRP